MCGQGGYFMQCFLNIFEYGHFFLLGHHVRLMCSTVADRVNN